VGLNLKRQDGEEAFRGNGKRTAVEEEEIWRLKQRNKALGEEELEFFLKKSEPKLDSALLGASK